MTNHIITISDDTDSVSLYSFTGAITTNWELGALTEGADRISELIDVTLQASSVSALQTLARSIETLFDRARLRQQLGAGTRVFINVRWAGEADTWRSEILGGHLEVRGAPDQFSRLKVEALLAFDRAPYWEGDLAPVPLSNTNGSWNGISSTGLVIYNCGDQIGTSPTERVNYAQIAAGSVLGSIPAPVSIELKPVDAGPNFYSNFYLGVNANSDPSTLPLLIEAESRVGGGTVVADNSCSGGNKVTLSNYSSVDVYWNLDAAVLQSLSGRRFRLLLRLPSRTSVGRETVQATICNGGGVPVFTGPEIRLDRTDVVGRPLVELGSFPIPPGPYASIYTLVQIRLLFRVWSGTGTTSIDYIFMMPTESYRKIVLLNSALLNSDKIVDDGIEGITYASVNSYVGPYARGEGQPVMIFPNRLQRLYLLEDDETFGSSITDRFYIRMWYRPRRLTI